MNCYEDKRGKVKETNVKYVEIVENMQHIQLSTLNVKYAKHMQRQKCICA